MNPGITTYVVDNLTAGTHYFAIQAINSQGGYSTFSNEAITSIETQLGMPALISTGLLRADPMYDPLRDLPRFRALITPPSSSN